MFLMPPPSISLITDLSMQSESISEMCMSKDEFTYCADGFSLCYLLKRKSTQYKEAKSASSFQSQLKIQ